MRWSLRGTPPLRRDCHPQHRIVTRDAGSYYRADPARWRGSRLRPVQAEPSGSFERAAAQLRAAGITVTAWAVLMHNSRLGAADPSCAVENAYGDSYPWALCAGSAAGPRPLARP